MPNNRFVGLILSLLFASFSLSATATAQITNAAKHADELATTASTAPLRAACPAFDPTGTTGCMDSAAIAGCKHPHSVVATKDEQRLAVAGIGQVLVKETTFQQPTCVSLTSGRSEVVRAVFEETASIFRLINSSSSEYRIGIVGNHYPEKDLYVTLKVPGELSAAASASRAVTVFAAIEQASDQEMPFVIFEPVVSQFDVIAGEVNFKLPFWAFSRNNLTGGELEAIVVLGLTPG